MREIFELMVRMEALKRTVRKGWNDKFPPGHKFQSRKVPNAESVADHSWSLALLALAVAERFEVDPFKLVWTALVHDAAESVTGDINTAGLDPDEKARVEAEKKAHEDQAMHEIFDSLGGWGQRCYELWLDYAEQRTPEAVVLRQLDKFECALQAVLYKEQGHELNAQEFLDYAQRFLVKPDLQEMMRLLRERAAG
jgi:putative hydrolase of HD superfamily